MTDINRIRSTQVYVRNGTELFMSYLYQIVCMFISMQLVLKLGLTDLTALRPRIATGEF